MSRLIDEDAVKRRMHETMDYQDLYLPVHFEMCMGDAPTIDAVQVARCGEWVSVDDRMPQNDGFYLVNVGADYRPIRVFEYKPNNDIVFPEHQNLWVADSGTRCFNWFVTHWMPLPEPPEGVQE